MTDRPAFKDIGTFEEFSQYYWYRRELSAICKDLGLAYKGTKRELNEVIKAYFAGVRIEAERARPIQSSVNMAEVIGKDMPLLACGFSLNAKFRSLFARLTGTAPFSFTANMAAAWRKVKRERNTSFTIQDMLDVYYGNSAYAAYDASSCQWNQFFKDFCADAKCAGYMPKLKAAAILWKKVRESTREKVYTEELLEIYKEELKGV